MAMKDSTQYTTRITLDRSHEIGKTTPEKSIYRLKQPPYAAFILHPSLGSPLILDESQRKKLTFFIAAGDDFETTFQADAFGNLGCDGIISIIDLALRLIPWDSEGKILKHPGKAPPVYPTLAEAKKNIQCLHLGQLKPELVDNDGRHLANIRRASFEAIRQEGLRFVYQITLRDAPILQSGNFFEVFWSYLNTNPKPYDVSDKYVSLSDRLVRRLVASTFWNPDEQLQPEKNIKPGPKYAYAIIPQPRTDATGTSHSQLTVDFDSFDETVPLLMRHPIFFNGKDRMNIAHIGDLHGSSRQHAFKNNAATVIPGADTRISPPIGNLVGNNTDNYLDLMEQVGDDADIDLLIVAGDLYDHLHNFDPASKKLSRTGQLWEAMYVTKKSDISERITEYPYGIDALAFYSVLLHFYNTKKKPVLMISGNHEAYRYPYGISPRMKGKGKVNAGIALDHNLTFYEAILLYGPGYGATVPAMESSNQVVQDWSQTFPMWRNFAPENYSWFFTVFSPLADYLVHYGEQSLVCLEWGDSEQIAGSVASFGGDLPRTPESGSVKQQSIGEQALKMGAQQTILCSHYTLINYELEYPLGQKGSIEFDRNPFLCTYNYGGPAGGHHTLYNDWLLSNRLSYTLAGHAHRVGLYTFEGEQQQPRLNPRSGELETPLGVVKNITGHHPATIDLNCSDMQQRTKVIVSASAGCMAKQNYAGEMSGQGMDSPAVTVLNLGAGNESIAVKPSRLPQAKPRFCVACDYIDVIKDGFWEYFRAAGNDGLFEMKPYWEKIHPKMGEKAKREMIESVTLYLVGNGTKATVIAAEDMDIARDCVQIKFSGDLQLLARPNKAQKYGALFLSIKFQSAAFAGLPGFKHYDFDSPWNIQVGLYAGESEINKNPEANMPSWYRKEPALVKYVAKKKRMIADMSCWQIMRHRQFGEMPDHKERAKNYPWEYGYNLNRSS